MTAPVPFAGLPAGPAAVWVPDASNAFEAQVPGGLPDEADESGEPDASDGTDSGAVWLPAGPSADESADPDEAEENAETVENTGDTKNTEYAETAKVADGEEGGRLWGRAEIPDGAEALDRAEVRDRAEILDLDRAEIREPAEVDGAAQDVTETMVIERIVETAAGTELLADVRRLVPPPIPVAFRGLPVLAPAPPAAPEQPYEDPVRAPEVPPQRLYGETWSEVARQIGAEVTRWGAMRMAAIHHAPDHNADDPQDTVPPAVRTAAYFGFGRAPLEWDGTWYVGGEPLPGRMTPAVVVFGLAQHARDHPAVPP